MRLAKKLYQAFIGMLNVSTDGDVERSSYGTDDGKRRKSWIMVLGMTPEIDRTDYAKL